MADSNFILNNMDGETGCIPNALIAKAMRMSMENKNVLLPETPNTSGSVDAALAGSLYYANGLYNAVTGTDDTVAYYVPQTTRVEVSGDIASGSVLTLNRDTNGVSVIWSSSTGGVTISFDATTSASSTDFGKWVSKSSSDAWPALYRLKLDLTDLSKQLITQPQLIVQLYKTTTSGIYNAVSSSMSIEKRTDDDPVVLLLYSNEPWAGIASILQTGKIVPASGQQRRN